MPLDLQTARTFALSLPEATEAPHHDMGPFRVRGKIFATVPKDGEHLHIFIDEHDVEAVVAERPDIVRDLLGEAWARKAPNSAIEDVRNRRRQ